MSRCARRVFSSPIDRSSARRLGAQSVTLEPREGGSEWAVSLHHRLARRGVFRRRRRPARPCAPQQIEAEKLLGEFIARRLQPLKRRQRGLIGFDTRFSNHLSGRALQRSAKIFDSNLRANTFVRMNGFLACDSVTACRVRYVS